MLLCRNALSDAFDRRTIELPHAKPPRRRVLSRLQQACPRAVRSYIHLTAKRAILCVAKQTQTACSTGSSMSLRTHATHFVSASKAQRIEGRCLDFEESKTGTLVRSILRLGPTAAVRRGIKSNAAIPQTPSARYLKKDILERPRNSPTSDWCVTSSRAGLKARQETRTKARFRDSLSIATGELGLKAAISRFLSFPSAPSIANRENWRSHTSVNSLSHYFENIQRTPPV